MQPCSCASKQQPSSQRFERRLPNTSYGVNDANTAAEAGGMTLEELERCFIQAVVDDYQQAWDELRRQRRTVLWEQAVAQSGVPRYLGSPDDLKLLLMKAINRKTPGHGYHVSDGSRLSFQGRWYVCPGLLSRLQGREFEVYYDRRDVGVLYLFVEGSYVGEAYCPQFMGSRVSEWEAKAMRKHDEMQEALALSAQGSAPVSVSRPTQNPYPTYRATMGQGKNGLGRGWRIKAATLGRELGNQMGLNPISSPMLTRLLLRIAQLSTEDDGEPWNSQTYALAHMLLWCSVLNPLFAWISNHSQAKGVEATSGE
jgi:hypothetical protein